MAQLSPEIFHLVNKPDLFMKELIKPNVTTQDLQIARKTIQNLADETNTLLKKNVYKNYALFIDTAKEISSLKNEMYTLSNLLSEEQKLLATLLDISISGDKAHGLTANEKKEVAAKFKNLENNENLNTMTKSQSAQVISLNVNPILSKELQDVLDKIDGITGILDSRNRTLLMHGELFELDSNEYKPLPNQGSVYAVLLNDCLLLSASFPYLLRFSSKKYKFQSFFELDNIAVINVKDPNLKNAFKILMSSQTKVFIANSYEIKTKWLESFEQAKKQRRASLSLQRRDSILFISTHNLTTNINSSMQSNAKTPMSPIDRPYSSILKQYEENEMLDEVAESDAEMVPDWLIDVPEDLDVFIAQRNFEEAVLLVHRVNDHFALYPKCCDNTMQTDLKLRINNKIRDLVDAVSNELQITPDRSLQSGPKSARKAVYLLTKLGKSSLATKLFLAQRSALLKFCLRQQKIDGATLQYIKRMSSVFFNNVTETCKEFQKAFDSNLNNNSGQLNQNTLGDNISLTSQSFSSNTSLSPSIASLIVWTRKQLNHFLSLFTKHVSTSQVPASIAAECFSIVRNQCSKLQQTSGLDLLYLFDFELRNTVEKIINDYKDKMLETIKLRCSEENWKAQNHSNKAGINKFIEEMKECNLGCVANYVFDECRVNLTHNTTAFSKSYLNALNDLLKLYTEYSRNSIINAITSPFKAQMKFYESSIKSDKYANDRKFIRKNVAFVIDTVLVYAEEFYANKMGENSKELSELRQDYYYLKNESNVTVIEKGSKTKVMIDFL